MHYPDLKTDEILGCKEVAFLDRQETHFPQLMRFSMDFDLCVLQLQRKAFSHISKRYLAVAPAFVLASRDYRHNNSVFSPQFNSLHELENYARTQYVDILHAHLFGHEVA